MASIFYIRTFSVDTHIGADNFYGNRKNETVLFEFMIELKKRKENYSAKQQFVLSVYLLPMKAPFAKALKLLFDFVVSFA